MAEEAESVGLVEPENFSRQFRLNYRLPLELYDIDCVRVATAAKNYIEEKCSEGVRKKKEVQDFIKFCDAIIGAGHLSSPRFWDDETERISSYLR